MKLNIMINKEVNNIINRLATNMGTSKRNVLSFALSTILEMKITKDQLEQLKEDIHLNYATTVTVNDEFNKKLNELSKYGMAKWKFYGYLVCDYFYKEENTQCLDQNPSDDQKDYVVFHLDERQKENIIRIAEAKSMTVNSLFIHYILNADVEMGLLEKEKKPVLLKINLTKQVKNILNEKVKGINVSKQFYLQQIATKIENDHQN